MERLTYRDNNGMAVLKYVDGGKPKMPEIQSAIDHIKTAIDVDPWAADMAEKALKKEIPQKWVWDRPHHVACPSCGTVMNESCALVAYKYCYNCGQKCEGVDRDDGNE